MSLRSPLSDCLHPDYPTPSNAIGVVPQHQQAQKSSNEHQHADKGTFTIKKNNQRTIENFLGFGDNQQKDDLIQIKSILSKHRHQMMENPKLSFNHSHNYDDEPLHQVEPEIRKDSPEVLRINQDLLDYLYQGDIALTLEQAQALYQQDDQFAKVKKRQALNGKTMPKLKWDLTVPYVFAEGLDEARKNLIVRAMKFWESQTCLNFEENANVKSKLRFFKGQGCYSYVGRIYVWNTQQVSIGEGCEHFGVVTHEIAHALGFFHAQSRSDRDSYVAFKAQDVEKGFEDQFDKESPQTNSNYGVLYDYGSVMHYSDSAFARSEDKPVLVASEPYNQNTMGQRIQPSFSDVLVMNKHYNCLDKCSNSICTCPWGFGGDLCSERQAASNASTTCGNTVQAEVEWQQLTASIGDSTKKLKESFTSCHWHIQAPEGKKVELRVIQVGNVEFKLGSDFGRTGLRMCCANDVKKRPLLTSATNLVVISAYTRFFNQQFTVKYRLVKKMDKPLEQAEIASPKERRRKVIFDPRKHSAVDWVDSKQFRYAYDLISEEGKKTNLVACKITSCRSIFTKRSSHLQSHAEKHQPGKLVSKESFHLSLIKFVVCCGLPFDLVSNTSFISFLDQFRLFAVESNSEGFAKLPQIFFSVEIQ
uniref:Metalloendopeptidase n=1 Tax=Ditylenchus dipsaci TaxID=166011 RepID=A0A915DX12_9BILA